MRLYKHKNHDEYVKAQILKNKKKMNHIWVKPHEINLIAKQVKKNIPGYKFGICHGVRNAWEVKQLRKILKINVIGTEISPSAKKFANTIQWDFHDIKDKWINNVDFIYSNSFDHSYDPEMCLDQWMKCIKKKKGICFIHWMSTNVVKIDAADCFAGSIKDYRKIINKKYIIAGEFGKKGRKIFMIKHKPEVKND